MISEKHYTLLTEYSVGNLCYTLIMTIDTSSKSKTKKRVRRDRRKEILREATKLFGAYGYRGTSLAAIAEAVGLSDPGLLHYYRSKEELLQGVLEYRDTQDEEKYEDLLQLGELQLTDVMEAIKGLVTENQTKETIVRLFTVLVGESVREDHPSHDYFVNRYKYARQRYIEVFTYFVKSGQLKPDTNVEHLATFFIAMMDGLQIQWLLDPENINMSDTFAVFLEIITNSVKKQPL